MHAIPLDLNVLSHSTACLLLTCPVGEQDCWKLFIPVSLSVIHQGGLQCLVKSYGEAIRLGMVGGASDLIGRALLSTGLTNSHHGPILKPDNIRI